MPLAVGNSLPQCGNAFRGQLLEKSAHAAALRLAEYFSGHEVLVCTHVDREHIHSHFVINSVNFDTGKKLHIAKEQLQELRQRNDAVCLEFSLPVFTPDQNRHKSKIMTTGEYHTAASGQSKKLQLMNIINDCMRHASTREEFIALMESEGCKVRWEKSRKNITYTTPSGWQCRDRMLFGDKYLKRLSEMPCDYPSRSQMNELLKSVKHLEQMVEQAGKQKEKSFYLSRFRMPYIPWGSLLLWSAMLVITGAVLWAMWYSSTTLWNAIKPLFQ